MDLSKEIIKKIQNGEFNDKLNNYDTNRENWYALLVCIVTECTAQKALSMMGLTRKKGEL